MVVHVVRRAVDDGLEPVGHAEVAVVDGDGPDVDEDKQRQVGPLVHGEEEDVNVVRQGLDETVHRIEGVTGKGCRDLPFVMGFVQPFVQVPAVQGPMNPVDHRVGEEDEGHAVQHDTPSTWKVTKIQHQ